MKKEFLLKIVLTVFACTIVLSTHAEITATTETGLELSIENNNVQQKKPFVALSDISLLALTIGIVAASVYLVKNRRKRIDKETKIQEQELTVQKQKIDFLTNIANDLKTPISLIYNPVKDLMERKSMYSDDVDILKGILKQTDRLNHMVSILLNGSVNEQDSQGISLVKDNMNQWLNIQMEDYRMRCDANGLKLNFKPEFEVGDVVFDKNIVSSALSNVMDYAISHSESGTITVLTSKFEGYYRISIKDQGRGFTCQPYELFRRHSSEDDKNNTNGTDAGLSFASVMVGLLGGHLIAEHNKDGNGSTFHIDIPDSIDTDMICSGEIKTNNAIVKTNTINSFDTRNSSILIVDDDMDLLDYIKNDYHNLFKNIFTAKNGKEALEIARNEMPDVIVSDIIMPIMNGFDLCKIIKSDLDLSHIPVILLTSRSNTKNQETGYKMGADAFVPKPFDSKVMYKMIANQLKNRWEIKKQYSDAIFSVMDKEQTFSNADEKFILNLNCIIRENLSNPNLSIPFLTEKMGMSKTALFNKMNNLLNVSASRYIRRIRMEAAKELLAGTDKSISQIAQEVGFTVCHYFSSVFKDYSGLTPREFREQYKLESFSAER